MNSSSACFRCEAGTYQTGSGASALKCIELQRGATWPGDLALTFASCCVDCSCHTRHAVVLAPCIWIFTLKPMYSLDTATVWQDWWLLALVVCVRLGLIRLGQVSTSS
jgi:hypothetical protein